MTNRTHDPDTTLAAWFEEGPTELPESIRRSIATTVRTTTQERRGFGQPWRFPMNGWARNAAPAAGPVARAGGRGGVGQPWRFPMNGWARYAVLAAAVVVLAVGGWYLLGPQRGVGGAGGSPS